jgi:Tol biopolymer transport system component
VTDLPGIRRWLPDNKRMIFTRERRAYIVDIETKDMREIAIDESEEMRNVGISVDGTKICHTTSENGSDIWLLDLANDK